MEITHVSTNDADGTTTIYMTAAEAKAVRDDLGKTWSADISPASDSLYQLLAGFYGDTEVTP